MSISYQKAQKSPLIFQRAETNELIFTIVVVGV